MEILKSILIDFVLFSGIEGFIFCLFFRKVFGCKKFNFIQWFILSFVNCIISKVLPPVVYQIAMVAWMVIFIYAINKRISILKSILASVYAMGMLFLIEIPYEILLKNLLEFEALKLFLTDFEIIKLFVFAIPLRVVEIINIFIMEELKMKAVIGGVVRK